MRSHRRNASHAALLAALLPLGATHGQGPPDGFVVSTLATGLSEPVALDFAPDGRLFVAERGGCVRIVADGVIAEPPLLEIDVYVSNESGLLGMALDPDFAQNHYVYIFATVTPDEQRILRVTERDGVGRDLTVIRGNLPTTGDLHNGGGLAFAPDGTLYFGIGDTGRPELSPRLDSLAGKICRIHPDGSIPEDNPLVTPTGSRRAVYARGFRNPFRFCFASDGRLFVADVGSNGPERREEITLIGPDTDGGWPATEGHFDEADHPGYSRPLIAYHDDGAAVVGCVVYEADSFPAAFRGDLFHLDFVSSSLFRVRLDGDVAISRELFMKTPEVAVDLTVSPDGGLVFAGMFSGTVWKVTHEAAGAAPPVVDDGSAPRQGSACGAGIAALAGMAFGGWSLHLARRRSPTVRRAAG